MEENSKSIDYKVLGLDYSLVEPLDNYFFLDPRVYLSEEVYEGLEKNTIFKKIYSGELWLDEYCERKEEFCDELQDSFLLPSILKFEILNEIEQSLEVFSTKKYYNKHIFFCPR